MKDIGYQSPQATKLPEAVDADSAIVMAVIRDKRHCWFEPHIG